MNTLKERYEQLEKDVEAKLRELISNSKTWSKLFDAKCLRVNIYDYDELLIDKSGELSFVSGGHLHSLYSECDLNDLIELIDKSNPNLLGYQIVSGDGKNNIPECFSSFQYFENLELANDWLRSERVQLKHGKFNWVLAPVFEGDIEEPTIIEEI